MLTLKDKMRSRNAERWHTVLTTQAQNVADHSHCMGIIAEEILIRYYDAKNLTAPINEKYYVLKYAQVHDLPEIITGDQPSVFKAFLSQQLPEYKEKLNAIECKLVPELLEFKILFFEKPYLRHICKAADILEAISFFSSSRGLDEQHNDIVVQKLNALLEITIQQDANLDFLTDLKDELINGNSCVVDFEQNISL